MMCTLAVIVIFYLTTHGVIKYTFFPNKIVDLKMKILL